MAKDDLSPKPKSTKAGGDDWWFYEEPNGLEVVFATPDGIAYFTIPLASIRAYLRRLDKPKEQADGQ